MDEKHALVTFQGKNIRRIWYNDEWYFSVVDIIGVLTDSSIPRRYWSDLKIQLKDQGFELYGKIVQLRLPASDGKYYETDCANTESMFRIIQSIPSPKAEPFKLWLAQVGYDRIKEIENPELAQKRMKEIYRQKGYSDEWIEKRARGISIRDELTDEWNKRGVKSDIGYAILTAEISKATFGMNPSEYKKFKGLDKENLRDHMDDIELILTMLGEATTTRFTRDRDSQKFPELRKDAKDGGDVAGSTRKDIENRLGKQVTSKENYIDKTEKTKRLERK
jgi:hypothetical protein